MWIVTEAVAVRLTNLGVIVFATNVSYPRNTVRLDTTSRLIIRPIANRWPKVEIGQQKGRGVSIGISQKGQLKVSLMDGRS